jgi:hypothetical protein
VIITDQATLPRVAPAQALLGSSARFSPPADQIFWNPQASPSGPVSIVVSAADRRAMVLRNGVVIGSSPVAIDTTIGQTLAFILRSGSGAERVWLRVALPGQTLPSQASPELRGRIRVPEEFRRSVEAILQPGTTILVTPDALGRGTEANRQVTVVEDDAGQPETSH